MARGVKTREEALVGYRIETEEGKVYNPIGEEIGSKDRQGYFRVTLYGEIKTWYVRRCHLIFWEYHERWPEQELDHFDRNKENDSISNLREVNHSDNMINRSMSDNRDLPVGVYLKPRMKSRPYVAVFRGKHLGHSATVNGASQMYLTAKENYYGC